MKIEFLYFDGCPNVDITLTRLKTVVENMVPDADVVEVQVTSQKEAEEKGFYGSPSIHINGRDLEHDETRKPSMSCRIYADEGAPAQWLIEAGILRALKPKGLLVLCVANSARSQIGEGIARMLAPADVRVQSAGSDPTSPRPEAIAVLKEVGVDASGHTSKNVADIDPQTVDTVITLCDAESCPVFLGKAYRLHWGLPDPGGDDQESRMAAFRSVREELIKRFKVVFS